MRYMVRPTVATLEWPIGEEWRARDPEETSTPPSAFLGARQKQEAQRGDTWVLRRGSDHPVPADVAEALKAAGIGTAKLPGVLWEVPDPEPPPAERVVAPAMSAEAAAIIELRAMVDRQGAELAELRKKR